MSDPRLIYESPTWSTSNHGSPRVFTAEQLFDSASTAPDVLAHEAFLTRARAEHEAGRTDGARIALAAYAMARVVDSCLPMQDPVAVAGQIGTPVANLRRRLDVLPASEPEVAHLTAIVAGLAEPAGARRRSPVRASLMGYAFFLEQEGRLAEALDVIVAVGRTWPGEIPPAEFGMVALHAARLNRLLARWSAATAAYRMAENAGASCGDRITMLRGRLGQGAVLRGQGNLPASKAIARSVIAESEDPELRHIQAGAYADLGVVYMLMERRIDGLVAIYEAFLRTVDPIQRMRVLGDLGVGLAEVGAEDTARLAFRIVADTSCSALLRMNARLELMALDAAAGNRLAFEHHRQAARDFADQMPPSMACDFRFKAGRGLACFGQTGRGRALIAEGMEIAENHGLNEWYFRLERALGELVVPESAGPGGPARTWRDGADPHAQSALARMATGLQEFADATSGQY